MAGLIGMITPMLGYMCLAIIMGCIGNLMATFITVLGGYGFLGILDFTFVVTMLILFAVLRGVLRYAEQACNHYIAFKILARIRHKVFAALRKLAPAKLDGSEKGNLISIITSDIELLEVFYAHTISPIAIAVITSVVMILFLGSIHISYALTACVFYLLVGAVIPLTNGKRGGEKGQKYRNAFGELNTCVLDNLYGLEEILEYAQEDVRLLHLHTQTENLEGITAKLKKDENVQRVTTDGVILFAGIAMAILGGYLVIAGQIDGANAIIAVIAMTSSFGPTAALSALSNNLHHTLASGNRVLDILEETPVVEDVLEGADVMDGDIKCENVRFSYQMEDAGVLEAFNASFKKNKIHGILGTASGEIE